jgi:hypothetical protein
MADDPAFKALDRLDSLTVFEDHMTDLENKEDEESRMERERQKRESRKARDGFRVSLGRREKGEGRREERAEELPPSFSSPSPSLFFETVVPDFFS